MGCLGHPGLTIQVERAPCSRECSAPTAAHRVAPSGAWQNGFAERLIGSIRRECLDRFVVWGETHLRRILRTHARYYNEIRTHWSLDKDAPAFRPIQRTGIISSHAILGRLHHYYYYRILGFRHTQAATGVRAIKIEGRQREPRLPHNGVT